MKRPRLYRDRRWIEGYTEAAEKLRTNATGPSFYPRMHRMEAEWRLRVFEARLRSPLAPRLTAKERGFLDGLLDAFGF